MPSGESEQTGEAGPETPVEEKPKRKRVSRKKAADSPEDTSGGEAAGEAAQASEEEDTSSGASDDLSAQGGDTPEHDDDEDLETDAFVLSDGGEEMPPTPLEGTGDDDTADAPMEGPEPAPSPKARPARRTASAAKTANRPKKEFTSRPLKDKPTLLSLDLNKLDEDLSEEERNEWNAIYASYRSKSILTGRIMGIDTHSFTVRNRETRQTERRKMLCAVIINYRVKVLIPEIQKKAEEITEITEEKNAVMKDTATKTEKAEHTEKTDSDANLKDSTQEVPKPQTILPFVDSLDNLEKFQDIVGDIMKRALQENNVELENRIADSVLKVMEILMKIQEKREEERYRNLDETIRSFQHNRQMVAATREKESHKKWFRIFK